MELKRTLAVLAALAWASGALAQQTVSTVNPNIPVAGTPVEQSGPALRANFQAAYNDINFLLTRGGGGGGGGNVSVVGTPTIGQMAQWAGVSTIQSFNLFGTANTWTGTNTYNNTVIVNGATSTGTLNVTGPGIAFNQINSNGGAANYIQIQNTGDITNLGTIAGFLATLAVGNAQFEFFASGGPSPFAGIQTLNGLPGGMKFIAGTGPISFTATGTGGGFTMSGLAASGDGTGLNVCAQSNGLLYRKATCP